MIWLLLFFLPSQLGIHFWPDWSMIHGVRIDYLSPTLYFTDILIFIIWSLSRFKVKIPLSIIILVTLNIFFSQSPFVSIYRWLRFYEYYWLFKYLISKIFFKENLKFAVLWTCVLTWSQFLLQRSLGGFWFFLGERKFDITTIGIAKTLLPWGLILRPYATFPHPNALAGFLLLSMLLFKKSKIFWLVALTLPLTLSRTGIFLEILILIYSFVKNRWWKIPLAGIALSLMFLIPGSPDSWTVRWDLFKISQETIFKYPLWGLGLGNFVSQTSAYHFQPVHNIPALALAELGLPSFLYLIILTLKHSLKIENCELKIGIAVIAITGMVDHYWWTLPQMQLLLTIFLAGAVQLNHGGICGLYRWWSKRKSGSGGLRVRGQKQ